VLSHRPSRHSHLLCETQGLAVGFSLVLISICYFLFSNLGLPDAILPPVSLPLVLASRSIMPEAYIPLLVVALLVLAFPLVTLLVFKFTRRSSTETLQKPQAPNCGEHLEAPAPNAYSPRLFVVAVLFVIFSVATIFLFSWAILYRSWLNAHSGSFAFLSMFVFAGILLVGYIWLYQKAALDWT
jgi:NADH-quinone oxidoreductase subunit A